MASNRTNTGWRSTIEAFVGSKKGAATLSILVILVLSLIFLFRNFSAVSAPNFYAEDGTVFLNAVYTEHPLDVFMTFFNGYLIVGQYALAYLAVLINNVLGGHLYNLPYAVAFVSCAFLGLVAALPFILFRKELGAWYAALCSLFCAFVPVFSFDYAVIGTIGNMKFIFFFVAFLFITYRNLHFNTRKTYLTDFIILLCVVSYITCVFLLPFALWPYRHQILDIIKKRTIHPLVRNHYLISLVLLYSLSLIYLLIVYIRGIPAQPGYLDQPFDKSAALPIIDRTYLYAVFYPLTSTLKELSMAALYGVVAVLLFLYARKNLFIIIFGGFSAGIGTLLFILNRPGVSQFFLDFSHKGGPDQFFIGQNLIVIFCLFWITKDLFKKTTFVNKAIVTILLFVYLFWAVPYGSSFGGSKIIYESQGTARDNISKACAQPGELVTVQLYPTAFWQWQLNREDACR